MNEDKVKKFDSIDKYIKFVQTTYQNASQISRNYKHYKLSATNQLKKTSQFLSVISKLTFKK